MVKLGRPGLPPQERRRVWELWKQGQSFSEISRTVGVAPGSVYSVLLPRGGIWSPVPQRSRRALTLAEREEISRGLAVGSSYRHIAKTLGRSTSAVSREVNKNHGRAKYRAIDADDRAGRARARPQELKLEQDSVLCAYVTEKLKMRWSPEQIANRLPLDFPDQPLMRISHEGIYRAIYLSKSRGLLPDKIHHCLRRKRPLRYSKHYSNRGQWRSQIKNARPLTTRPAEAETRTVLGHWEGDLIIGGKTSQAATIVDRTSRKTCIIAIPDRRAENLTAELSNYLNQHPELCVKTLTWDRGMELAGHETISTNTGIEIFFADPRSPWQRGTNENTNGLIRQYLPKKTNLAVYVQDDLDLIAHQLNTRPRKVLGYLTPLEYEQSLAVALTA